MRTSILRRGSGPLLSLIFLLGGVGARGQNWEWATAPEHTASELSPGSLPVWYHKQGMAVDAAGNQYIARAFEGTLRLGTTVLSSEEGTRDLMLAKRSAAGQWEWAVRITGPGYGDMISDVEVDGSGNVMIVGMFEGASATFGPTTLPGTFNAATGQWERTGFVARLTAAGRWTWVQKMVSTGGCTAEALAVDAAGNATVGGRYTGKITLGTRVARRPALTDEGPYVAKVTAAGVWQWVTQPGSGNAQIWVKDLAMDATGNVFAAGALGTTAAFGPSLITTSGGATAFVAKLTAAGVWEWAIGSTNGRADAQKIVIDGQGGIYVAGIVGEPGHPNGGATFGATVLPLQGLFVAKLTPDGRWMWARQIVGSVGYWQGISLAYDGIGSLHVAGTFSQTLTCGNTTLVSAGGTDVFVSQLTADRGRWLQAVRGGGIYNDVHQGMGVDANGLRYVTGGFNTRTAFGSTTLHGPSTGLDGFVSVLSARGIWLSAVRFGGDGGDNAVTGNCRDAAGNVYVTGYFRGAVTFGNTTLVSPTGVSDLFVAKLSPAGAWLWAVRAGGDGVDEGRSIGIDAGGNLYVTGSFSGSTAFGTTTLTSAGSTDAFVGRLSAAGGQWQWAVRAGGADCDGGRDLAVRGTSVWVVGSFASPVLAAGSFSVSNARAQGGTTDMFVGRLSTAGAWQWVVRGGAESYEEPGGIAVDGAGAAYVAGAYGDPYGLYAQETRFGSTVLPRLGYSDVFVAKLNAAGAWQWAVQGGTDTTDSRGYWGASYGRDIALDAGGGAAYVVGGFTGEIARFGPSVLVNSTPGVGNYLNVYQQQDLFVAKLATGNGVWQWARGAGAGGVPFYGNGDGDGGPVALDVASAVAVDGSGRVVVAGYSASPTYRAVFGGDTLRGNTFVARLTPGGAWEWVVGAATGMAEAYANSDRSFAYYDPYLPLPCLTLDPAGNAYVGGAMERKLVVPFGPVDVDGPGHGLTAFVAKVNPAAPARPGVPGSIVEVAGRLELVPNPAHGIVRLEGQRELLQVGGVVTVLNHQGEQVLRQEVRGGGEASLDIRGLSAGLYLVRVQAVGQEKAAVGRLVVE